ncbi:MAG: hypothetical protein EBZ77_07780, partial [Chitinophagia bacterium]|nr:hypothetical protein [Chitinophagia bacterium]
MKNLFATIVALCSLVWSAHAQTCHTQDTVKIHRQLTRFPTGIAISSHDKVVVTACRADSFGLTAPIKVWKKRIDFMEGYGADDSVIVTGSRGAAFDTAGNLYVLQTQRPDSNILIYDDTLALIGVIDNVAGAASWSQPSGIAFDAAQNLYVVSGDSVGPGPLFADVPNTGKLIRISNPLYAPTRTVLLHHLNAPKGINITGGAVYITEYGNNELSRFNLSTLVKEDSVTLNAGMDIAVADCRLYVTEHATNQVQIFNSGNLTASTTRDSIATPAGYHGKMGITLDRAKDLFFDINDSNQVVFYRGIQPMPSFTAGGSGRYRRFCVSATETFGPDTSGIWVSADTSIVSVDGSGALTAHAAGLVQVYHIHGITDTFVADIEAPLTAGPSRTYATRYATNLYDSAHTCIWYTRQMYNPGTWNYWWSTNPSIAYVSWVDGNVWPLDTGVAYIVCANGNSCGSVQDSFRLIVDPSPRVDTIAGPAAFCYGTTANYTETTPNGRWICDAPGIATIDSTGMVVALGVGTATISYKVGNICDSIVAVKTITILHDPLVAPIVGPHTVCAGTPIVYTNDTAGGHWYSNDTTRMTLLPLSANTAGATPLAHGMVHITYIVNNFCGTDSAGINVVVHDSVRATFSGRD